MTTTNPAETRTRRARETAVRMTLYPALAVTLAVIVYLHPRTWETYYRLRWQRATTEAARARWFDKLCRLPVPRDRMAPDMAVRAGQLEAAGKRETIVKHIRAGYPREMLRALFRTTEKQKTGLFLFPSSTNIVWNNPYRLDFASLPRRAPIRQHLIDVSVDILAAREPDIPPRQPLWMLAALRPKGTLATLRAVLPYCRSDDSDVESAAKAALRRLRDTALAHIDDLVASHDESIRAWAAGVLADKADEQEAKPYLERLATDRSPRVRSIARTGLLLWLYYHGKINETSLDRRLDENLSLP